MINPNVNIGVLVLVQCIICVSVDIFHEESKITLRSGGVSEYFGYTVVLTNNSLLVGAPKARDNDSSIATGLVFTCPLTSLTRTDVTCSPLRIEEPFASRWPRAQGSEKRDDMWYGATVALLPHEKILICAPRWTTPYKDSHMLAHGLCYVQSKTDSLILQPLKEMNRQAYIIDGKRSEYGDYGTHLNFYAYGQAGVSASVAGDSVIIGAPGLLQWTGGVIDYKFLPDSPRLFFSKQPTTNPYYTDALGPDDYFGYTVASGVFDSNKTILYVAAAPRSKMGYGQVLIFEPSTRESEPLRIRSSLTGPQLGSYFGASLLCTDVNNDGRTDLLVGAPNYVMKNGDLPYDQGAVFVYLNRKQDAGFSLEPAGLVSGPGVNGARFGTSVADAGDVDGDGYRDIAAGAPWEDHGRGAVYIYRGSEDGLRTPHVQRLASAGAAGFGLAVSRGVDLDGDRCNELAIGAYSSSTAYVYRCVPTIRVKASMKLPDMMDLPLNATNFTALFCNSAASALWPSQEDWPRGVLKLKAKITVDRELGRAELSGDDEFQVEAVPGQTHCSEETVLVKSRADLSNPITLNLVLEPVASTSKSFSDLVRLSEDSELHSYFEIQLTRDCGEDLVCRPKLDMFLEPLDSTPYIPGAGKKLGVKVTVLNKEEPAFGAKVHLNLPLPPTRVPTSCSIKRHNLTCNVPAPLNRGESIVWNIELEFVLNSTTEVELRVGAELDDPFYTRNISDDAVNELILKVSPQANFTVVGTALINSTLPVTRQKLADLGVMTLVHYYEIINYGPSDWPQLVSNFDLPENVSLSAPIQGCQDAGGGRLHCVWSVPARASLPIVLTLRFNLKEHGKLLEDLQKINFTSVIYLHQFNKSANITSTLVLEPAPPAWPLAVGLAAGLLLLAAIVCALYRYGFFSRHARDRLKRLQQEPGSSEGTLPLDAVNESSQELLLEDSD